MDKHTGTFIQKNTLNNKKEWTPDTRDDMVNLRSIMLSERHQTPDTEDYMSFIWNF